MALQIPNIDRAAWAERIVRNFPPSWTGDTAKVPGGGLYSLCAAGGEQLAINSDQLQYAHKTTRLTTAIDAGLDSLCADFFNEDMLRRVPGEQDEGFRARVKDNLFLSGATRPAIIDLITRLVGTAPRVMEPWNPYDTMSWDGTSYWDVDTEANSARWGDPALRAQGFIESALPSFANQGDQPVWCYDAGFAWDSASGCFLEAQASWFLGRAKLDELITRKKVYGTIVWRKYRANPLQYNLVGGTKQVAADQSDITITIYPPVAGLYAVLAMPTWNTAVEVIPINNSSFRLVFSTPAPPGNGFVEYLVGPITAPGVGVAPVPSGQDYVNIGIPAGFSEVDTICAIPSWETPVWYSTYGPTQVRLNFAQEAPDASSVGFVFIKHPKAGVLTVDPDAFGVAVPIASRDPLQAFGIPNWNTQVQIVKTPTLLTFLFSQPAPAGALLRWAYNES